MLYLYIRMWVRYWLQLEELDFQDFFLLNCVYVTVNIALFSPSLPAYLPHLTSLWACLYVYGSRFKVWSFAFSIRTRWVAPLRRSLIQTGSLLLLTYQVSRLYGNPVSQSAIAVYMSYWMSRCRQLPNSYIGLWFHRSHSIQNWAPTTGGDNSHCQKQVTW